MSVEESGKNSVLISNTCLRKYPLNELKDNKAVPALYARRNPIVLLLKKQVSIEKSIYKHRTAYCLAAAAVATAFTLCPDQLIHLDHII